MSTVFFGRGNIGEAWRRKFCSFRRRIWAKRHMEIVYFGMMIGMKTFTRLYCEWHRAPHRSVCANYAVPKVVLIWPLLHCSLRCHGLIVTCVQ